jgi:putative tryptophan/tyrosine transport system permease protein
MNIFQLVNALEVGFLYALVALGAYLALRVICFPDLTVDGSFSLGACTVAAALVEGMGSISALTLAFFAGGLAGFVTGFLHLKGRIPEMLAGILTTTALYSLNLRIMNKPNVAFSDEQTIFKYFPGYATVLFLLAVVGIVWLLLSLFLNTQLGLSMRGAGINPRVSESYGIRTVRIKFLALILSNAVVGAAGGLMAQFMGFADVGMGVGTIVIVLASIFIGEIFCSPKSITWGLLACVVGSVVYRELVAVGLQSTFLGLRASDLNLVTAAIVVVAFMFSRNKKLT